MNDGEGDTKTLIIGAVIALLIVGGVLVTILRFVTKDDRLLVLKRDTVQTAKFDEGDQVKVVGTLRRFGFARGFDANTPGDTGGANALDVITVTVLGPEDDVGDDTLDIEDARNDEGRREQRVVVVGKVDKKFGKNFFTLVDDE